jgi:hypothetical protein
MDANVIAEQLKKITGKPGQAGVILHGNGGHIVLGDGKHPITSVTIRPDGLIEVTSDTGWDVFDAADVAVVYWNGTPGEGGGQYL